MKKLTVFLSLAVSAVCLFGPPCAGSAVAADNPVVINTCWMDESPAFNIWYAKKQGWDKEEGLDINMLLFSSGPAQMEALPSGEWSIGATSTGGMLIGAMRHKVYVVAPLLSEGEVIGMYIRPDHPAAQIKGWNPAYPDVYGSPETVRGMTILMTSQTTSHYLVGKWLAIFGLTQQDVKLVNMEQSSMLPAFEKGIGDVMSLWAPFTFAAEKKGWRNIGSGTSCKALTSSMYMADRDWADRNPELVAKFLRVSYRATDWLRSQGTTPEIIKDYQQFMSDFCGMNMSPEDAKLDLETHPRWTLDEGLALMDASGGESAYAREQREAAEFFTSIGRFSPAELDRFNKSGFVVDTFVRLVKTGH